MENIFKMQSMIRGMYYRTTNMMYIHTCTIGNVYLFIAIIAIPHMKLVQLSCNMVCGSRIRIPVGIYFI